MLTTMDWFTFLRCSIKLGLAMPRSPRKEMYGSITKAPHHPSPTQSEGGAGKQTLSSREKISEWVTYTTSYSNIPPSSTVSAHLESFMSQ